MLMASPREEFVFRAKLAEKAERYEEMVDFMKKVVSVIEGDELTAEERNLLSHAYKCVVGARREAWRIISSIEGQEENRGNEVRASATRNYKSRIESELSSICHEVLELLDSKIIDSASNVESKVFYLKMKGDYYRYLAEFKTGSERIDAAENTRSAYTTALDLAYAELAPTHQVRLGLALNLSVFYYEIMSSPAKANDVAQQAFDEAVGEMDNIEEESYKESTAIMQLLRDNLTVWNSDLMDDPPEEIRRAPKQDKE